MNAGGLLLLLSPLALWTGLTAAPPPPAAGRLLQCQQSRDCPTGHSCVTFRGRRLCGPTAADASTETSGAPSLSEDKPQKPVGRPADQTEAGPSGNSLSEVDPSVSPVPSGTLFSTDNPTAAPEPAVPKTGCISKKNATSSGAKPVSTGQPGEATSGHQPVNGSGHAGHSKPSPCAKPAAGAKPTSTAGHGAHEPPAPGGEPASCNGSVAHGKPTSGHEPGPQTKPGSAGKPKPESQPEKDTEKEKEGDDDDDDDEDSDEVKEHNLVQEGSHEDEDAFDRELDYGLGESPFNPNDYHDAWSDEDSDDPQPGFEEGEPPEEGEATFDAWGDAVRLPPREAWPRKRSAGFLWGARKEPPAEAPSTHGLDGSVSEAPRCKDTASSPPGHLAS